MVRPGWRNNAPKKVGATDTTMKTNLELHLLLLALWRFPISRAMSEQLLRLCCLP